MWVATLTIYENLNSDFCKKLTVRAKFMTTWRREIGWVQLSEGSWIKHMWNPLFYPPFMDSAEKKVYREKHGFLPLSCQEDM